MDVITSAQLKRKVRDEEFQVWILTRDVGKDSTIKFFLTNNVIMLPSEY